MNDMVEKMDDSLAELLRKSREAVDAMTSEEYEEMLRKQGESWARAEMSWPAPRYTVIGGEKVFDSYEDYCNG